MTGEVIMSMMLKGVLFVLLAVGMYLLTGAVGLPVFAGFAGGVQQIAGASGGYLIGYLFLAVIGGRLAERWKKHLLFQALGLFIGMLFCYLFGTLWLTYQAGMEFQTALWVGVIPYAPFDVAKIAAALVIYSKTKERLKWLNR